MKNKLPISLLLCGALCACSPFKSSQPPATLYAIHAETAAASESKKASIVVIPEPVVPAGFETAKIAVYLDGGRRMDYAAGASWPAPLAKMLQGFIVQSARGVPGVLAATPESGMAAAWRLNVIVNDFEPVYGAGGSPELRASLTFTLVSLRNDQVVDSFTLARRAQSAHSVSAIVSGMESLLRGMMTEAFGSLAARMGGKKG